MVDEGVMVPVQRLATLTSQRYPLELDGLRSSLKTPNQSPVLTGIRTLGPQFGSQAIYYSATTLKECMTIKNNVRKIAIKKPASGL